MTKTDNGIALHPASYWCELTGIRVVDPDGWRNDGTPFDWPISRSEFYQRLATSTVTTEHALREGNIRGL